MHSPQAAQMVRQPHHYLFLDDAIKCSADEIVIKLLNGEA
jgi:hypothetical protein